MTPLNAEAPQNRLTELVAKVIGFYFKIEKINGENSIGSLLDIGSKAITGSCSGER